MIHDVVATLSEVARVRLVVKSGRLTLKKILFFSRLNGSQNSATGCRYTSLLAHVACTVLSQTGRSSGVCGSKCTVFVLQRSPSPVPSIQTYITCTLSPVSRSMYLNSVELFDAMIPKSPGQFVSRLKQQKRTVVSCQQQNRVLL